MSQEMNNSQCKRRAFTLVELILVLAVVSILMAIGLLAMGRVMDSRREAKGLSNLRQIGVAVAIHIADDAGRYPRGLFVNESGVAFSDWALFLSARYLNQHPRFDYSGGAQRHSIFQDPSATFPDRGTLHFSANPLLFVSQNLNPVTIAKVSRASQTVMVMDAGQQPGSGNSLARAVEVPLINSTPIAARWNQAVSITPGNNADTHFGAGSIRWRARRGTAAKFLFADGHAKVLRQGELLYRNLWIEEP
jgi:prepilin-type N-terminal cleavage/methylation domain-containing protein